ncbi:flavodoxin family protein [Peptoniphilus indolicus]|nr:flavodoxin family protein [Peptoniphilus indolicus]
MRGIIAYSSKTGNTKKMAEHIYLELKKYVMSR